MDPDDIDPLNSEIIFDTPNEDASQIPNDAKVVSPKESDFGMTDGSPDPDEVKRPEEISYHYDHIAVSEETDHEDDSVNPSGLAEMPSRLFQLPASRIKCIAKLVPSVQLLSSEAIAIIGKATEMFLSELVKESYQITLESGKKTLTMAHIEGVIQTLPQFEFLDGMFA